jgi:NADP-dependent 3-hydroxy acid dehydrogenase YdfG
MTEARVALITRLSANTGRTMAQYLARHADTVVVNGRNLETVGAVALRMVTTPPSGCGRGI